MAKKENTELIDLFEQFYGDYYRNEIGDLAQKYPTDQRSLVINWTDLDEFNSDLAEDYIYKPDTVRLYAEEALRMYDLPVDVSLGQAHVRLRNLPRITKIDEIRSEHTGCLIMVPGTIRSSSSVMSTLVEAAFECQRCGTLTRIPQNSPSIGNDIQEPHECQGCERQGPFKVNTDQSRYIDQQHLRIESNLIDQSKESPDSLIVVAEDDLAGTAKPGEEVLVSGVVGIAESDAKPLDATVRDKYLRADTIEEFEPSSLMRISDDDVEEFKTLSQTSDFFEQLVDSIVPHILGYETEKLAVGLQLFGGVRKVLPDETVIPGTIHLALISDPGTFVDEISEYATRLAPKSVQVNGTDTTQVGLTSAAYVSSSGAKNWELDAGALALANNGLAAITQADQLDNDALAALKSVMRQQEIKASKGTATQTIPAQTSVLVSARPKYGRFDQYESIGTQIDLTPDLISQFDLIFTVSDLPEAEADQKEAEHILKTHHAGEAYTHREQTGKPAVDEEEVDSLTSEVAPEIDPEFLRKYIAYARRYCHPTLTEGSKSVIEDFYVDLRLAAEDQDSPVPVSARKIAAIVRLAEASARARLSDTIEEEDAQRAVNIIEYSLKQIGLNPDDEDFDADAVEKGTSKAQRDRTQKIRRIIEDLESEYDHGAPIEEIIDRAEEEGISEGKAEHEIDNLKFDGEVYEPRTDYLRTT